VLFFATSFVVGCAFNPQDAKDLVQRVGEERVLSAADSLRPKAAGKVTAACNSVTPEAWPEAIKLLKPKTVCVDSGGVFIQRLGFFVQEEGVYLVFKGSESPREGGVDPAFSRVFNRIYWYQFTG
jgi:hypothetical protein